MGLTLRVECGALVWMRLRSVPLQTRRWELSATFVPSANNKADSLPYVPQVLTEVSIACSAAKEIV